MPFAHSLLCYAVLMVAKNKKTENDGSYLLKLVLYLIIGSQWVRLVDPSLTKQIPIPIGLVVGVLFATHEHFQIDRKIEYAVLIIATLLGFWSQAGLLISIL